MPRRRSSKTRGGGKARPVNRNEAKITKWNKRSDIPQDKEDLFHASRDKVLLEGNDWEQDDDGDDDEVFALKGMNDDDEEEVDEDVDMDENEDYEEEFSEYPKKGKKKKKAQKGQSSDEDDSESEEEESWGKSKAVWYSSNAGQLESDDEEGHELEEQEANRLQSKMREEMVDADFGLEDAIDIEVDHDIECEPLLISSMPYISSFLQSEFAEPTFAVVQKLPQDQKSLLRHLEKTIPETLALARDWQDAIENLAKTKERIQQNSETEVVDRMSLGMLHIYYQALLTYATTLAFYFHLASSEKYVQRPELLKEHTILRRLLTLKQSLTTFDDIGLLASDSELDDDDDDDDDDVSMSIDDVMADGEPLWAENDLDDHELELLLEDQQAFLESDSTEPPKKKRKTAKTATAKGVKPPPAFDLVEPDFVSSKASSRNILDSVLTDAFGEATSLQHADAADKSARRKTLQFHTSRIESTSARRKGARSQALGGDDDLPYRERRKEKDARLIRENTRSRGQGGEDLEDIGRGQADDGDHSKGPDGYYDLVKKTAKNKKEQKQAEYDAMVEAARPDFSEDDATGPRSLTRAILANKGLTPHRAKSVRNPRVKKRLKFEKAKKKLSSQKAVYKGGLAETGRYDGERSGISKVVKSVQLG
ncbi:hypothetical protein H0H93_009348 [Arthromyces matolae]|nr:hypothetical protein H0H93_009348 [Arthromyces matolae]